MGEAGPLHPAANLCSAPAPGITGQLGLLQGAKTGLPPWLPHDQVERLSLVVRVVEVVRVVGVVGVHLLI